MAIQQDLYTGAVTKKVQWSNGMSPLDKPIRPVYLALRDEGGDLGSNPGWILIFLLLSSHPLSLQPGVLVLYYSQDPFASIYREPPSLQSRTPSTSCAQ